MCEFQRWKYSPFYEITFWNLFCDLGKIFEESGNQFCQNLTLENNIWKFTFEKQTYEEVDSGWN